MMRFLIPTLVFVLTLPSFGQRETGLSKERQEQLDTLVELIKNNRVKALANKVIYPIRRPNPIPDIETKAQFILYYPVLFDSAFKEKLTTATYDRSNTIDRYDGFGLFSGAIWLSDGGSIMTVNHRSDREKALLQNLHLEAENSMHPSVEDWRRNVLVCQTDKFLIRIDQMDNHTLRYLSWTKPTSIGDAPDLMLLDGTEAFQGSSGGVIYTFTNGAWSYIIDRVEAAEDDDQLGLYLRVYQNDIEKLALKTEETK